MGHAKYPPFYVKHGQQLRMVGVGLFLIALIAFVALRWWRARNQARTMLICVGSKAARQVGRSRSAGQFIVAGGAVGDIQAPLLEGVAVL